jgi:hypothetical protein
MLVSRRRLFEAPVDELTDLFQRFAGAISV